jgi:putrescine transport system substrate-binding protein
MLSGRRYALAMLCISASSTISCGHSESGAQNTHAGANHDDNKVINLFVWSDYLAPDTIASFEKLTGVKVRASYFDTNETLETRMLTGNSGFDVVVPSAAYFQRQIRSGAYLPLDKKLLPNLGSLDPELMSRAALYDPGNVYGVVHTWGTFGIGYNEKMVAQALHNASLKSWHLILDPAFAIQLAKCGINVLDNLAAVVRLVLNYLGRDPNAPSAQDLADVEAALLKIRPYIRTIYSSSYIDALANGDICIALGYNGDIVQARNRAREAKNGIQVDYVIPDEGTLLWFTLLAIPRDAPHVANAHLFINYLMNPQVLAYISNSTGFANASSAALPLLNPSIASDRAVYPTLDQQRRLIVQLQDSPEQLRAITRIWQRFKTWQ